MKPLLRPGWRQVVVQWSTNSYNPPQNLQYAGKIWLESTIFVQKPIMQSTNLQDFGLTKMWSTWIFQPNIQSMDVHNLKKRTTAAQIVKKKDNLPFKRN